ncbi:19050_t:CDS:2, partial [Racocetra fulgida]
MTAPKQAMQNRNENAVKQNTPKTNQTTKCNLKTMQKTVQPTYNDNTKAGMGVSYAAAKKKILKTPETNQNDEMQPKERRNPPIMTTPKQKAQNRHQQQMVISYAAAKKKTPKTPNNEMQPKDNQTN